VDLSYSPDELAFQDEVRTFMREKLPADLAAKVKGAKRLSRDDLERWHAILNERGWLAEHWPTEYGGAGWGPVQRHIFEEEASAAGAPRSVPFGINMLGPVLIAFGSEEQKQYYLPRILSGEDWWCQGYSEPGAGSDLASLKTTAVRDGDHYVLNGQKTWTTLGHYANMIFVLAKTDTKSKPQEGISFFLVDLATPGIEMRPIITLDGEHEVNEVFFDDVRVPAENIVGEENKGWTYAKFLLTYERTGIAGVGMAKEGLRKLKELSGKQLKGGRPLAEDPYFARRMANVEIDLSAMEVTNFRILALADKGGVPGAETSMLKIKGTQIGQEITDLMRRAVGPYAAPYLADALDPGYNEEPIGPEEANALASKYFNMRKTSIFGGSNEIQRNIISKMMLGL